MPQIEIEENDAKWSKDHHVILGNYASVEIDVFLSSPTFSNIEKLLKSLWQKQKYKTMRVTLQNFGL